MSAPALLDLLAAGLFLGLIVFLGVRRPPHRLAAPLLAFNVFVLLFLLGDLITLDPPSMLWEQVGIALFYTGSFPAAAACWVLAVRYAEVQGMPLRRFGRAVVRVPVALAALAWLAVVTNPWHHRVLIPVMGANNRHLAAWYPLVGVGYLLTWGAVALLIRLAWRSADSRTRRNAWMMAVGIGATLVSSFASSHLHDVLPTDLTAGGLCVTAVVFLFGAYRTRLFSLMPVAHRAILLHDPAAVLVANPDGGFLEANRAAERLLQLAPGTAPANVFALLAMRLRDANGGPFEAAGLRRQLESRPALEQGSLVRLADRPDHWLRVSLMAVPPDRHPPDALCLRMVDVSAEQRITQELRRARDELERRVEERTADLRASEERYRLVSSLSSDVSFSLRVTRRGEIQPEWFAGAMTRTTGYTADDMRGFSWLRAFDSDVLREMREVLVALARGERTREHEFRIKTTSGEERWVAVRAVAVEHLPGGVIRVLGSSRDVTDRRRAEEERLLLEVRTQEAQRLESLGVLAGGIAHDFNNLLAVILGQSVLVLREMEEDSPLRTRLERIREAARYAAQLTEQMLTYAGRATPKARLLDLSRLLGGMRDLLAASMRTHCRLEMDLGHGLPPILGDDSQLQQVVMNLVLNAAEAAGDAGATVRVSTSSDWVEAGELAAAVGAEEPVAGACVLLEISDDGPGMDAATRRHIFDPFFTTKDAGRGLGLGVVLGIVRAHHGSILVDSESDRGTRFRIFLPRAPATVGVLRQEEDRQEAETGVEGAILVVDDDAAVLELTSHILERAGYRVTTAGGGRAALACLEEDPSFDAVVLDLSMPEVDGAEVLRSLRRRRPDLPVLMLSGFNEEIASERVGELGEATLFLRKPYEPGILVSTLARALERSRTGAPH